MYLLKRFYTSIKNKFGVIIEIRPIYKKNILICSNITLKLLLIFLTNSTSLLIFDYCYQAACISEYHNFVQIFCGYILSSLSHVIIAFEFLTTDVKIRYDRCFHFIEVTQTHTSLLSTSKNVLYYIRKQNMLSLPIFRITYFSKVMASGVNFHFVSLSGLSKSSFTIIKGFYCLLSVYILGRDRWGVYPKRNEENATDRRRMYKRNRRIRWYFCQIF